MPTLDSKSLFQQKCSRHGIFGLEDIAQSLFKSPIAAVQVGEPFMLFNVQHEALLSVKGSFADDTLPIEQDEECKKGDGMSSG